MAQDDPGSSVVREKPGREPPAGCAGWTESIERDGFAVVAGALSDTECDQLVRALAAALEAARGDEQAVLAADGVIYAARNVLGWFPAARQAWRTPTLIGLLRSVLGPACGLVRGLYFDKPPGRTWTLPWHKDLTIAVRDNRLPSTRFSRPTVKAGVPHVEAPVELLEAMLTLRIHLDDVTEANGPLRVVPGSHKGGKALDLSPAAERSILVRRGDVLAIRPLVAHASTASRPEAARHRRILHLEFSGWPNLPDGYAWQEYVGVSL
jgi:hypothetical protein